MSEPTGGPAAGVRVSVKRKVVVNRRPVSVSGLRPVGGRGRPPPPGGRAQAPLRGGAPRTASQQALLAQAKAAASMRRTHSGSIPPPPIKTTTSPTKPPLPGSKPALPGRKPTLSSMTAMSSPNLNSRSSPARAPPAQVAAMPLPSTPPKPGAMAMPLPTPPPAATAVPLPSPPGAGAKAMPLPVPPKPSGGAAPLPIPPKPTVSPSVLDMPLPTPTGSPAAAAMSMPLPTPTGAATPLPVPPKPAGMEMPLPAPPKPSSPALPVVTTPGLPPVTRPGQRPVAPRKPQLPTKPKPQAPPKPQLPAKPKPQETMQRLTWPTENTPFGKPDEPTYIIFDNSNIKACTIEKLVENVTNPKSPDPALLKTFLLTYRSITTPLSLLDLLKLRFLQPLPEGNETSVQAFTTEHQRPMQLRVLQLLKSWVSNHWYDFEQDEELIKQFSEFVETTVKPVSPVGNNLANIVARNVERGKKPKQAAMFSNAPPKPILPTKANPGLLDLHPQELARQLTLIEVEIFRNIKPNECLGLAWSKKDGAAKAPNVLQLIDRFNMVSGWVASEIVRPVEQKHRVEAMSHFIQVANECKKLNNFNGCMEVLAGLEDASVHRLKNHFSELSKKTQSTLAKLKDIMNSDQSFKNFRAHLKKCTGACIPYLGMYLTDLTFIEENGDTVGELHNIFKRRMVATVITNIQQYQQSSYNLEEVPVITKYLHNLDRTIMDKEDCYQRSLLILPRGGRKPAKQVKPAPPTSAPPSQPAPKPKAPEPKPSPDDFGEMEDVPGYRFNEPDSSKNLRLAKNASDPHGPPTILAGSLEKLVERVTYPKYPDPQFLDMFLLTYRTFTTGKELMELLIMRYSMPKPVDPAMLDRFKRDKLMPVMLRVINVLKNWVDKYSEDFAADEELTTLFTDFADKTENSTLQRIASMLKKNVESLNSGESQERKLSRNSKAPPPQFPLARSADPSNLTLLDIHPEETARQLCLVDAEVVLALQPLELLDRVWKTSPSKAATVYHVLCRITGVKNWVINEIMKENDMEQRKNLLEHFIDVGTACGNLKNFHSMCGIASALESPDIKGLLQTWDSVGKKFQERFKALIALSRSVENLKTFREKISKVGSRFTEPCVPYLRSFLGELVAVEDNEKDCVEGDLINVQKRKHLSQVINELLMYGNEPYNFEILPWLHELLKEELEKPPDLSREAAALQDSVNLMDATKLKDSIKAQLQDPDMKAELTNALKEVFSEQLEGGVQISEMKESIQTYKTSVMEQLATTHKSFVIDDAGIQTAADKLVKERYPGKKLSEWSAQDKEGTVYGWPETVTVNVVESCLIYQQPSFNLGDVSVLSKIKEFYESTVKKQNIRLVALCSFVDSATRTSAEGLGMEVIAV